MTCEFLPEAREEFFRSSLAYEMKETGLGLRFRMEAARVLQRIRKDPFLWSERRGGYRRVNFPIFLQYFAYVIRENRIIILAVGHGHQRPHYWKSRMKNP